jgi:hypothetical protein
MNSQMPPRIKKGQLGACSVLGLWMQAATWLQKADFANTLSVESSATLPMTIQNIAHATVIHF